MSLAVALRIDSWGTCSPPGDVVSISISLYIVEEVRTLMKPAGYQSSWRKGFIAVCALNMMTRGPVYGSMVASELYDLSDHQWKPGAGAIYPALHKLLKDGLCVSRKADGRTVYTVSRKGEAFLHDIREASFANQRYGIDFGRMWLSILGPDMLAEHLLRRLKTNLTTIEDVVAGRRMNLGDTEKAYLLNQALGELRRGTSRLDALHHAGKKGKRTKQPQPRGRGSGEK